MKTIKFIILLLFPLLAGAQAGGDSLNYYLTKSRQANEEKNYPLFVDNMKQALRFRPGNSIILYNIACGYSLSGQYDMAGDILGKLALQGKSVAVRSLSDPDLAEFWKNQDDKQLEEKIRLLAQPKINSKLAYSVDETDLIPEGIAFNPDDESIFLSSLYKSKIVKVEKDGSYHDFVEEKAHGLGPTIGMKVDPVQGLLWVASGVHDFHNRLDSAMIGMSGLFAFELETGHLVRKYMLPQQGHFLNDLDIAPDGTIYLSDSKHPAIYRLQPGADDLEKMMDITNNYYPNGIAYDAERGLLYLSGTTINVIDPLTGEEKELKAPDNVALSGDGLYVYKGSLIAVQNGDMNRISRFTLDESGYQVTAAEILEENHPDWVIPTTATLKNNMLYYIANSQLRAILPSGELAEEQLKPVQVRVVELDD